MDGASPFASIRSGEREDEPVIGRVYDEENYQIGFVDMADTPYAEAIATSREVGYHLYRDGRRAN